MKDSTPEHVALLHAFVVAHLAGLAMTREIELLESSAPGYPLGFALAAKTALSAFTHDLKQTLASLN